MMKVQAIALTVAALGAAVVLNVGSAHADTSRAHAMPGEKIDSGLGEMPRYGTVVGQKVDSGLGELPHYRHWTDKTGRAPMRNDRLAQADTTRK
jgi:hypothetical protein